MPLYRNGAFVADAWTSLTDGEPLPIEGRAIVSLARWRAEQAMLAALPLPLGVRVEAGERLEPASDDLARLALLALAFPRSTDGRAYSQARKLREQEGYRGELRAVGDVLLDQIPLMLRCGFDAFEISHAPTLHALERGHLPIVTRLYQPASESQTRALGGRHWIERRRLGRPVAAE